MIRLATVAMVLAGCLMEAACAIIPLQDPVTARFVPFEPAGHLMIVGGGPLTDEIRQEFSMLGRARDPKSLLVIIPTASELADNPAEDWHAPWKEAGFARIETLHTRDRNVADSTVFVEPLRQATAIWLGGGSQERLAEAYGGTAVEQVLIEKVQTGGVVGGTSAGAAIASRVMIAGGSEEPDIRVGFDLLPNAIVDQHFSQRNRQRRLQAAVWKHPECVGVGLDESTAVIFHHRTMRVVGEGSAHLVLAETPFHPVEHRELKSGTRWLDWTSIVRWQRERRGEPFPSQRVEANGAVRKDVATESERSVPHGSLLIVGGGLTREIVQTFVERAGGGKARIVVLPTAVPGQERPSSVAESYEATLFAQLGVEDINVLDQTDSETVNSEAFSETISRATGIWFGGGRQWRFVDAYEESRALAAMKHCLRQGGIIGGSSAGATIQGELLIRGAPVGNQIMVQDGYRRGFGFLSGVGIDQHFSQRNRFLDLEQTIRRFPTVLGLGIDEETAILVEKTRARVLGQGAVYVYAAELLPEATTSLLPADRPLRFANGQAFDLETLKLLSE